MSKNLCLRTAVVTSILITLILTISARAWGAPNRLISDSGQTLSSVFEGLRANPALRPDQLAKYQPLRRQWRGIGFSRLPGLVPARITYGYGCPTSSCSGNYTNFFEQPGGCVVAVCDRVMDFYTDYGRPCTSGEYDNECGDGQGTCCANADECTNYRGCPIG